MDLGVSFQERPKSSQRRPKSGPGRYKSGQERPWSGPRAAKSGPRAAKSGPEQPKSGSCCRAPCRTKDVTSRWHRPLGLYNNVYICIYSVLFIVCCVLSLFVFFSFCFFCYVYDVCFIRGPKKEERMYKRRWVQSP